MHACGTKAAHVVCAPTVKQPSHYGSDAILVPHGHKKNYVNRLMPQFHASRAMKHRHNGIKMPFEAPSVLTTHSTVQCVLWLPMLADTAAIGEYIFLQ